MKVNRAAITVAVLATSIVAGMAVLKQSIQAHASTPAVKSTRDMAAERQPYDPNQLQQTIDVFAHRAQDDPKGAIDCALLAGFYLQRCRETGDIADAQRAEAAARRSLSIRTKNNQAGYAELAMSLFTQHRFPEAMKVATFVTHHWSGDPQALATQVEIETESGDDRKAVSDLSKVPSKKDDPYPLVLAARLGEFHGTLAQSQKLLEAAASTADQNYDMPRENVAWFHFRVGNVRWERGDCDGAIRAYEDALAWYPRDYRTMLGLAKVTAGQGNWPQAISWGEKSAAIVPMPETIGLLQDCYHAAAREIDAKREAEVMAAMATLSKAQGTIYDRQRAMYDADHGIDLRNAMALARHELTVRHDIYAYDTLGWVLYKNGKLAEADRAMSKALSTGSQDSLLYYHAGMVAGARHDNARAEIDLNKALTVNPYFQVFGPSIARSTLVRLTSSKVAIATGPSVDVVEDVNETR